MKFGQLIEYNLRNIIFEKSNTNVVEKLAQTFSWKIKIEHISGSII